MTDRLISALDPAPDALDGSELVPIDQGGDTVRTTTGAIAALASGAPPGGAAGGDLTGTYPDPTVAANVVDNSKLAQAPAATVKGNPTNAIANEQDFTMPVLGPLVSPYITDPLSPRTVSAKLSSFTPNAMSDYTKSGVTKAAVWGNAGSYGFCDITGTGAWTTGIIAGLSTKTIESGIYISAIDRFIVVTSDGGLYSINPNTTPWSVDQTIITPAPGVNPLSTLIFLTGHSEFAIVYSGTTIRRYACATTTISLAASYTLSDTIAQLGYDATGDYIYASIQNVGGGVGVSQGRLYKIPRSTFASFVQYTDPNNQNPGGTAAVAQPLVVSPSYVYACVSSGSTIGMQWDTAMTTSKLLHGIIGSAFAKFALHPTNGFMYGMGGSSLSVLAKIDPSNYGYVAIMPIVAIGGGTTPAAKDIFIGADGYFYVLISDSGGVSVQQFNQ